MPAPPPQGAHTLDDFAPLLAELAAAGFEVVVIGGMAVAAYARLLGESVLSGDLDVHSSARQLGELLDWCPSHSVAVRKWPQPRNVPVALLEWDSKEVNVLTSAPGLTDSSSVLATARTFRLSRHGGLEVLVVDPFDLLRNKLLVDRPKDRPHQEVLLRFLHEEVVETFREGPTARERFRAARRLLEVTGARVLPPELAHPLLPLAREAADLRFLVHHAPDAAYAREVLQRADPETAAELRRIAGSRGA